MTSLIETRGTRIRHPPPYTPNNTGLALSLSDKLDMVCHLALFALHGLLLSNAPASHHVLICLLPTQVCHSLTWIFVRGGSHFTPNYTTWKTLGKWFRKVSSEVFLLDFPREKDEKIWMITHEIIWRLSILLRPLSIFIIYWLWYQTRIVKTWANI